MEWKAGASAMLLSGVDIRVRNVGAWSDQLYPQDACFFESRKRLFLINQIFEVLQWQSETAQCVVQQAGKTGNYHPPSTVETIKPVLVQWFSCFNHCKTLPKSCCLKTKPSTKANAPNIWANIAKEPVINQNVITKMASTNTYTFYYSTWSKAKDGGQ